MHTPSKQELKLSKHRPSRLVVEHTAALATAEFVMLLAHGPFPPTSAILIAELRGILECACARRRVSTPEFRRRRPSFVAELFSESSAPRACTA